VSKMVRVGCLLILLTNGFIALALERRGTVTSGGYPMPGARVVVTRDQEKCTTVLEKLGPEERSQMKRQLIELLLADRFKLAVHWETKELPVYALVADKGGAKLTRRAMLWGVPVRLQAGGT
jgi:hypothetical protein